MCARVDREKFKNIGGAMKPKVFSICLSVCLVNACTTQRSDDSKEGSSKPRPRLHSRNFFENSEAEKRLCAELKKNPDTFEIPIHQTTTASSSSLGPVEKILEYRADSIENPLNISLVKMHKGMLVSFGIECEDTVDYQTHTVVFETDENFKPRTKGVILRVPLALDTSNYSTRAGNLNLFIMNDEVYGLINESWDQNLYKLEKVDGRWKARFMQRFEMSGSMRSKVFQIGWVPLVGKDKTQTSLLMGSNLEPNHTVVEGDFSKLGETSHLKLRSGCYTSILWDRKSYGDLRGSTPALYSFDKKKFLGFFYALHRDGDEQHYNFGAYTIDPDTFCVEDIARKPIELDKTLVAESKLLFPSGLTSLSEGKYAVGIASEDSAIKILIVDKMKTMDSLMNINEAMVENLKKIEAENILADPVVESYLKKHKVYLSMTTSPQRIDKIHYVIEPLIDSSLISKIYLNLPKLYSKKKIPYMIPEKLKRFEPKLQIVRFENDMGPISKLIPAVRYIRKHEPDGDAIIITLDDDTGYSMGAIGQVIKHLIHNEGQVFGASTQAITFWNLNSTTHWSEGENSRVIEGFGTIGYRLRYIDDKMMEKIALANSYCFVSDDLVLSYVLDRNAYKRVSLNNKFIGLDKQFQFTYGFGSDALHKGQGLGTSTHEDLNSDKYQKCNEYLAKFSSAKPEL